MRKGMLCPTLHGKPANQYDKTCPRSHCWRGVGSDGGGGGFILCPVQAACYIPLEPSEIADVGPLFDLQNDP